MLCHTDLLYLCPFFTIYFKCVFKLIHVLLLYLRALINCAQPNCEGRKELVDSLEESAVSLREECEGEAQYAG